MKPPARSGSVLILTPEGRDGHVAAAILQEEGIASTVCVSLQEMTLELATADCAIIALEALLRVDLSALAHWIERQPPWSDFPFILLSFHRAAADSKIIQLLGNVTVLERPFHPSVLVNAVRAASRARQRQREAENYLAERRQAEVHKDLLLRELHHRVKNSLATVLALLRATARSSTDVSEFTQVLSDRIQSLSKTHALLIEGGWRKAPLEDLLWNELGPYHLEQGPHVALTGPVVELPPEIALPVGMAVHELATNAAKYGCLSTAKGRLHVSWSIETNSQGPRLLLNWSERGGPPVASPPRKKGFGSTLLEKVLVVQCEARVKADYDRLGLLFRMDLPMRESKGSTGIPVISVEEADRNGFPAAFPRSE